ncbi:MAG: pyrrolo-quinoline quinone, partial [Sphingomonas sp.]|nr:pyrrolo-quinoline quinone [Sphingomonas sp.]
MTQRLRTGRIVLALALLASLGGCGIFNHNTDRGPKTAVVGNRVSVLNTGSDAVADPSLADVPVVVPEPAANDSWTQPGGNATKTMGDPALPLNLRQGWSTKIRGGDITQRIGSTPAVAE